DAEVLLRLNSLQECRRMFLVVLRSTSNADVPVGTLQAATNRRLVELDRIIRDLVEPVRMDPDHHVNVRPQPHQRICRANRDAFARILDSPGELLDGGMPIVMNLVT